MGYIGVATHLPTIDPNFLGHPSRIQWKVRPDLFVDQKHGGHAFQRKRTHHKVYGFFIIPDAAYIKYMYHEFRPYVGKHSIYMEHLGIVTCKVRLFLNFFAFLFRVLCCLFFTTCFWGHFQPNQITLVLPALASLMGRQKETVTTVEVLCAKRLQKEDWVVATQIFFIFHPYLGKIPILTNIFQIGWNHQLEEMGKEGRKRVCTKLDDCCQLYSA